MAESEAAAKYKGFSDEGNMDDLKHVHVIVNNSYPSLRSAEGLASGEL